MVTIQQGVGCNTKCFILNCIQGVKSRVLSLLSASRWRISYQIFYHTPSTPCPRDPAMECDSRRTDHSPQKAFALMSLELFNETWHAWASNRTSHLDRIWQHLDTNQEWLQRSCAVWSLGQYKPFKTICLSLVWDHLYFGHVATSSFLIYSPKSVSHNRSQRQ